jgi:hypothetical protein
LTVSDGQKRDLIDRVISEGVKRGLFSSAEVSILRRELADVSLEELLREYVPRWYGDLYRWQPVDARTWLFDPDFMNLEGQIWPVLADDFVEIVDGGYKEVLIEGAIGYGKSYMTSLLLTRSLYELSCYKNPQLAVGLADNSAIVIANLATKEKVAKEVVFEYIAGFVRGSPYFRRYFPPQKDLIKELAFPHKIRVMPAASTQGSVIGQNIFSAAIDEANFLFRGSSERAGSVNDEYDLAKVLYNAISRRMKSRFGDNRGVLIVSSSSMYPDDFTTFRKRQAEESGERIFYRRYSQWAPKPAYQGFDQDPSEYFLLSIGDAAHRPRIVLRPDEQGFDPALDDVDALKSGKVPVIRVPNDFRPEFRRDIDMAVRDIAGYATSARFPFFRNIQPIIDSFERAKKRNVRHPWSVERTTLLDDSTWVKDRLNWEKRMYHHFAHVDLALSQDACGIAIVRLDGAEQVVFERPYYDEFNGELRYEKDVKYVPRLTTVLTLQVKSIGDNEVPVGKVRQVLMDLVSWGFMLTKVTYDQYMSAESIQALIAAGIDADKLSVDRTMDAYHSLKEALDEERLDTYEYTILLKEASELERDLEKKKIDHPPRGSKDVTDALSGAVHNATVWVRDNPTIVSDGEFKDDPLINPSNVVFGGFSDDDDDLSWLYG